MVEAGKAGLDLSEEGPAAKDPAMEYGAGLAPLWEIQRPAVVGHSPPWSTSAFDGLRT